MTNHMTPTEPIKSIGGIMSKKYGIKLFIGSYKELTVFLGRLHLRFSIPQTAAWWGEPDGVSQKRLYCFGKGHSSCEDN